ncbi:MAG TPA: branched-chain amino acid ABC transporter permease [Xanthobacteraceae bacterium]|nr:branched-chain amino acid ABC transporter permease [Xanthobacteraceae bacterium]
MQLVINLLINGAVEGLMTALIALALVAIYLVARFPQAATGDYVTAGAYSAYIVYTKVAASMVIAGLAAASAIAILSLTYFFLVFGRFRGRTYVSPLLASVGVAFLTRNVLTFFVGHDPIVFPTPLLPPIRLDPILLQPIDLVVVAAALIVLGILSILLRSTDIGREIRAVSDDPDLAKISGIRSRQVLIIVWLIVGLICGVCGFLLAIRSVVEPDLGWNLLLNGFAGAILGGLTSFPGAVVGSLLIGLAQELSIPLVGGSYKLAVPFLVILVVLLVKPAGLFGRVAKVR